MHYRILIMFYCLSTYAYSQSSIELKKEDPQSSRCEGNGRSELTPYLSKLKSKKFKDIRLSRTKERAYSLIEKARLIKNNQEFTYTQAGCDHM
ncbi:MAG: hypothetical protein NTX25_19645, partial [Proteobacteria bacterium]|nr:hypothetical protein [Pseudomonadota bacterium]